MIPSELGAAEKTSSVSSLSPWKTPCVLLFFLVDAGNSSPQLAHRRRPLTLPAAAADRGDDSLMRCAKATLLLALGVPLLLVYRLHNSIAGSACGVVISILAESSLRSSCDGATGDELRARFLFFRGRGVLTGCDPRQINCSSGETMGFGACLEESSTLPTRSANGSLVVAGVDGGGQLVVVGGLGVLFGFPRSFMTLDALGVWSRAATRFSFSASRSFADSTKGAPSMNWKALSFVRVCVDGMMGGPVTTCRAGGAGRLLW